MRRTAIAMGLALCGACGARHVSAQTSPSAGGAAIVQTALKLVGDAYSSNPSARRPNTGFSDIGFIAYVYNRNGIKLHLNWRGHGPDFQRLLRDGPMVTQDQLQPGDVVFFQNTVWYGLSHVGIYIGDGKFVHAEWYNRGVAITSFENDPVDGSYWTDKYLTATRPWSG